MHGGGKTYLAGQFLPADSRQARSQGGDQSHRLQAGQLIYLVLTQGWQYVEAGIKSY